MERQKEIQMRNLNMEEIGFVSGGNDDKADKANKADSCDKATSSVGNQKSLTGDIADAYEGLIAATVYVMERVAAAM